MPLRKAYHVFALARYLENGTADVSFNPKGQAPGTVLTPLPGSVASAIFAIALTKDGKIVVAGQAGDFSTPRLALARYNADGSLDRSFNSGGYFLAHL